MNAFQRKAPRSARASTSLASWSSTRAERERRTSSVSRPRHLQEAWKYWTDSWVSLINREHGGWTSDLLSGLTVAAVAIPLNVALAVACGLPASAGLIAGAIGGALAAVFGGARLQVTGPAAALSTLVLAIVQKWGAMGAVAAAFAVGVIQIALAAFRGGRIARFVPESVLIGFTTGVGLKLLDQQIPLLLDVDHSVSALFSTLTNPIWLKDVEWLAVLCGALVMLFMMGFSRFPKVPAAILGIALATGVSSYLGWDIHRVGAIPAELPSLVKFEFTTMQWLELGVACIPLALLAAIESLISARAVDRLTKDRESRGGKTTSKIPGARPVPPHHSELEVFGQGVANLGSGLFGGMPVSGVIVRSSVNVQSGGKSRLASLFHGILLLVAPLVAAGGLSAIPIAALAGLLCLVGFRLVEIKEGWHLLKTDRFQAAAFFVTAAGVVTGNLTAGLLAGIAVAALPHLFRRRSIRKVAAQKPALPAGVRAIVPRRPESFGVPAKAAFRPPEENWNEHVSQKPLIHPTAYVHPNASVIGRVVLSPEVHVAAEVALRADEGTPFFVGAKSNIQDGVVLHALKKKWVRVGSDRWAIYIGERVSLAHQALIHGPCYLGDDVFVGFKAVVHDSVVGSGCFIGIGAIVVGVEIPDGKFVPHGALIDSAEKVQELGDAQEHHRHFNEDVVEVNAGLVEAYQVNDESPFEVASAAAKGAIPARALVPASF